MNEQHEKSVKLLRFIGWHPVIMPKYHSEGWYRLADEDGNWDAFSPAFETEELAWNDAPNLYEDKYIKAAWHILNWVYDNSEVKPRLASTFSGWWDSMNIWELSAIEAQAAWLDKILELSVKEYEREKPLQGDM